MCTDFLFAKPTFFRGVGSMIDIFGSGNVYNESISPEEADEKAFKSDWGMVGEDMRYALNEHEKQK